MYPERRRRTRRRDTAVTRRTFRHPAEADLDTAPEQAHALLVDLRESFAPSYLTLISIIQGVLLGLVFELISEGRSATGVRDPASVLVFNNVVLIALVWNEYRMGSSMFKWIPSLLDAVIPFTVGALQAALILTTGRPTAWIAWLAVFYVSGAVAFENMYRRSAAEERNAFVLHQNRDFRRLNPLVSVLLAAGMAVLALRHAATATVPGAAELAAITAANLLFLVRGEVNWQVIVRAARTTGATPPRGVTAVAPGTAGSDAHAPRAPAPVEAIGTLEG